MTSDPSYTCRALPVLALDAPTRRAMAELYLSTYEATDAATFDADLAAKDEVLLLHADGRLVGFTTLRLFDSTWRDRPLRVVFSGDTVVHRAHWGQQALSFAWVRRIGDIRRQRPDTRLVWLLLVKGHRTYRYLHVFARTFHPKADVDEARSDLAALGEYLARQRFGSAYNARTGVVEFEPSRGQLRPDVACPRADELARPGVAYFLERNPGWRRGHELVCVCDLDEGNLKPLTQRLFRRGLCNATARSPAP